MKPQKLRSHSSISQEMLHSMAKSGVLLTLSDKEQKPQKLTKKDILLVITMLYTIVFTWTLYGNISTFYPPYRKDHHPSITDTMVGVVLATFEGGMLVMSPIISLTQQKVGRKNYIVLGNLITMLASLGFGFLVHIENDIAFYALSLALRFFQGSGNAASSTAMLSIISFEFPDKREQFYGYCEAAIQCGLMIGPVVGQILYTALGFEQTFYCTAAIVGSPIILQLIFIPQRINNLSENDIIQRAASYSSSFKQLEEGKPITYKTLLTNKRAMMGCMSSIFAMIFMLFYETIYSEQLISMGVSDNYIGYLFALGCMVATINSPIVGYLCKYIPKIYLIEFAFGSAFVALILFGPSEVLGFPQSLKIMIAGMALLGFSVSFIFTPLLPEIIEAVQEKENIGESSDLNDRASGLFNSSYAIGCMLAPILGGIFNDFYGYRTTCDIMAFSSLAYGLIFFFVNLLPYAIQKRRLAKLPKVQYKQISISEEKQLDHQHDQMICLSQEVLQSTIIEEEEERHQLKGVSQSQAHNTQYLQI